MAVPRRSSPATFFVPLLLIFHLISWLRVRKNVVPRGQGMPFLDRHPQNDEVDVIHGGRGQWLNTEMATEKGIRPGQPERPRTPEDGGEKAVSAECGGTPWDRSFFGAIFFTLGGRAAIVVGLGDGGTQLEKTLRPQRPNQRCAKGRSHKDRNTRCPLSQ